MSDDEYIVELLLNTSISPDTSMISGMEDLLTFPRQTMGPNLCAVNMDSSDDEDMETVANMLALPESDDLDIAATIYGEGDDLDALQIERHTFDPLGRAELDVAGFRTPSGQEIIPFPL